MPDFLVDTDVLVDFLRGNESAERFMEENAVRVVLSPIVLAELYAGAREEELPTLDELYRLFPIEPVTAEIARIGGMLKWQYAKSHGVGLADALLAATAQKHQLEIKTLNIKHFPMFPDLEAPYQKSTRG